MGGGCFGGVEHGVLSPFRGALMVKRKWPQRVDARCSHFFALTSILLGWVKLIGQKDGAPEHSGPLKRMPVRKGGAPGFCVFCVGGEVGAVGAFDDGADDGLGEWLGDVTLATWLGPVRRFVLAHPVGR